MKKPRHRKQKRPNTARVAPSHIEASVSRAVARRPAERVSIAVPARALPRASGAAVASRQADDRQQMLLMILPVLLIATVLAVGQALRLPLPTMTIAQPEIPRLPALARPAAISLPPPALELPQLALPKSAPPIARPADIVIAQLPLKSLALVPPHVEAPRLLEPVLPAVAYRSAAPLIEIPTLALPALGYPARGPDLAELRLAALQLPPLMLPAPPLLALPLPVPVAPPDGLAPELALCRPPASYATRVSALIEAPDAPAEFGARLALAAREQLDEFVIYSAKYMKVSSATGDIPALYGACSDVIVRAFAGLGLDIRALLRATGLGQGDANIDHRRTETLRRLFQRLGASMPVSEFPEDYQPGDIVTYERPHSRVSRAHIAIVSAERAPTGRFMIIHNRGWGPQSEDALFVDRITGHYRFTGREPLLSDPVTVLRRAPAGIANPEPQRLVVKASAPRGTVAGVRPVGPVR